MAIDRRRFVAGLAGLSAVPAAARPGTPTRLHLAAAWDDGDAHRVGVLALDGHRVRVLRAIEVPTRAHGLLALADGSIVAAARRPGDWLLRWRPAGRGAAQWLWAEAERRFNGHVIASADGRRLFSTEADLDSGAGWVGVRDARSLAKLAEWPTHGIDAHALLLDGDTLVVANGGILTAPETGRRKRELQRMDSSLVRLALHDGSLRGQWRLPDARLSLRHLARATGPSAPLLGVALQAQHDDPAERLAAPVLALFDGRQLQAVPPGPGEPLAGYGGDIAATATGFAVSAPRANAVALWRPSSGWLARQALTEACALAMTPGALLAGGQTTLSSPPGGAANRHQLPAGLRLDNHWVAVAG